MKTRSNRSSLSQQAIDLLREQIYNHVLAPGQRLDEAVLAEQLGISRTPLRDLEEIFPIMATLEGRVAHEVASKCTPAQLKMLDALHEKLEKHAAAGDVNRYYETNYVFHDQLQECAGNRWLQIVIGDVRKLLKLSRHHSLRLQGLHQHDADAAERVMRGHLLAQLDALREMSLATEVVDG